MLVSTELRVITCVCLPATFDLAVCVGHSVYPATEPFTFVSFCNSQFKQNYVRQELQDIVRKILDS